MFFNKRPRFVTAHNITRLGAPHRISESANFVGKPFIDTMLLACVATFVTVHRRRADRTSHKVLTHRVSKIPASGGDQSVTQSRYDFGL
jgi:hypothetical protein